MADSKAQDPSSYQEILDEVRHYLDVPMTIKVQLAQRRLTIREILQLRTNSIVELPKSAGENVDVFINGRLVAFGEVLDMEGDVGIRLTDLASQP